MTNGGYVVLTLEFHKEGKKWVAYCKELGTATFGYTLNDAEDKLKEAISLHLKTLEDVGEREKFFKKHNIKYHSRKPTANVTITTSIEGDIFVKPYAQAMPQLSFA
ncbi:MAG: type II toxin-antitoxin system HicB family antitoxin [Dehalococcoidia bacterium]|nr:type II toxin-antitoxin system HicB family antitoxin [Dehalococcoidia bacterium]